MASRASAYERLRDDYPWTQNPIIACAPMRLIAQEPLAMEVSKAGGIGFVGGGSDLSTLEGYLERAETLAKASGLEVANGTLPVGIGFLNWGADRAVAVPLIRKYRPAAVWFFAPRSASDLTVWSDEIREATNEATKVWVQVGTVAEALEAVKFCNPDVLVVQGGDAGGHGLNQSASLISLLPEVADALVEHCRSLKVQTPVLFAAGGIADGRGVAAALSLGAAGVVMGTRYLAASEANLAKGYRDEVIRAADGGVTTIRTGVYDRLRGTTEWPERYGGRGVINQSYVDAIAGMDEAANAQLYEAALAAGDAGWGPQARLTTYAGTAIGLVHREQRASSITEGVRMQAVDVIRQLDH